MDTPAAQPDDAQNEIAQPLETEVNSEIPTKIIDGGQAPDPSAADY